MLWDRHGTLMVNGNVLGEAHSDPKQDTRIYQVKFPNGTTKELLYNTIIENPYSRCDEAGNIHPVVKKFVGYVQTKQYKNLPQKWKLQVQWMDDSITKESLDVMHENYLYVVTKYTHNNGFANEPAFTKWVPHTIRQYG